MREVARRIAARRERRRSSRTSASSRRRTARSTRTSRSSSTCSPATSRKRGAMNIHTRMAGLGGGKEGGTHAARSAGTASSPGSSRATSIPDEILTDHPKRFRAMIVESANPVHSLADSQRMREALDALELVVVIDVAMTETARLAALRAAGVVAVREVGGDVLQPRVPAQRLPAARAAASSRCRARSPSPRSIAAWCARSARSATRIWRRCARRRRRAARRSRAAFLQSRWRAARARRPRAGRALRDARPDARRRQRGRGAALGRRAHLRHELSRVGAPRRLRRATARRSARRSSTRSSRAAPGVTFTVDEYEETWRRLATPDGKVHLAIPELLDELARAARRGAGARDRRVPVRARPPASAAPSTANTIFRDPGVAQEGRGRRAAHQPARRRARSASPTAAASASPPSAARVEATVEVTDTLQAGHVSLPNGLGLSLPRRRRRARVVHGVAPNELTASEDRDWLAGTPWHKHVPRAHRSASWRA